MALKQIIPSLYALSLGAVNTFLIDSEDGLILIDTGYPENAHKILAAVRELGKQPEDIRHILVTHCHYDHAGSVAALKRFTGARTYMHPLDAAIVEGRRMPAPMTPGPGILNPVLFRTFVKLVPVEPVEIEQKVVDGDTLALAGGIQAIHVPGHCAGQLAFLWMRHNVLFAADTAANLFGLGWSIGYEDIETAKKSLAKLANMDFEVACFGHGGAIMHGAAQQFRRRWSIKSTGTKISVS